MQRYELLDHTGDIQIRAFGATKVELFANAATAMMELMFGEELPENGEVFAENVRVNSGDSEALLVDWLSKLLFLSSSRRACCAGIELDELTETELSAKIDWVAAGAVEEIKAVTYYKLEILQDAAGWSARVTFDV